MRPTEFRLLGPLEVVEGDRALALGAGKQRCPVRDAAAARERDHLDRPPDRRPVGRRAAADRGQDRAGLCRGCARSSATAGCSPARPATPFRSTGPSSISRAFEQLVGEAQQSDPGRAAETLRRALALVQATPTGSPAPATRGSRSSSTTSTASPRRGYRVPRGAAGARAGVALRRVARELEGRPARPGAARHHAGRVRRLVPGARRGPQGPRHPDRPRPAGGSWCRRTSSARCGPPRTTSWCAPWSTRPSPRTDLFAGIDAHVAVSPGVDRRVSCGAAT